MIPLYKTHYPKNLGERLQQVFNTGMTSEGPEAAAFQKELQTWIGNPYIALTSSGTTALEIAGRLADVGPGDEVIASPTTCTAGLQWILKAGAKPIWCDVDPETGCIDANQIERLITPKTKAITFVDWAGIPAELEQIQSIADKYGLKTIEDAAQAQGARYKGHMTGDGQICDYTMISFQSIKIMSTVDGGCLCCKNKKDYERAILLRWFGLARGMNSSAVCWTGDIMEPGWKGHMNDVNAAIGREQLKYVDDLIAKHRSNAIYLTEKLEEIWISNYSWFPAIPRIPFYVEPNYWVYTVRFQTKESRAQGSAKLTEAGIGNNVSHVRNDKYFLFKGYERDLPQTDHYEDVRLNIPCGWWVSQADIDYIAKVLEGIG